MKKFMAATLAPLVALTVGASVFAAGPAVQDKAEPARAAAMARLVDINTATKAELVAVLGVGDDDADRIIAARPYLKKDQLKTKKIVPADSYEKIKRLIDAVC